MRHICTLVIRVFAGRNESFSRISSASLHWSSSGEATLTPTIHLPPLIPSPPPQTGSRKSLVDVPLEMVCVLLSRRKVAAARSIRKQACDSVWVMNLDAGQRRAWPTCNATGTSIDEVG